MEKINGAIRSDPNELVKWLQHTSDKRVADDQESQYSFWQMKLAEVRGNGFSAADLKDSLNLQRPEIKNEGGMPIKNPFLQELFDLAAKLHISKEGLNNNKYTATPNKMAYFENSNASLFFLRNGSLTYPFDHVFSLDLTSTQKVVTETCSELYLAQPPYKEFVGELCDQVLMDVCKRQLGLRLSLNGSPIN